MVIFVIILTLGITPAFQTRIVSLQHLEAPDRIVHTPESHLPITSAMKILSLSILLCTASAALLRDSRPECFPNGPACLRPQVNECRDALTKLRHTDPGYVTTFGRHLAWRRHTIDVPRTWQSYPKNCVVKLDTVTVDATDSFRLRALTRQGEEVVTACIIQGYHCGGVINVGPKKLMQLSIGHYSAVGPHLRGVRLANSSVVGEEGAVARNHSPGLVDEIRTS